MQQLARKRCIALVLGFWQERCQFQTLFARSLALTLFLPLLQQHQPLFCRYRPAAPSLYLLLFLHSLRNRRNKISSMVINKKSDETERETDNRRRQKKFKWCFPTVIKQNKMKDSGPFPRSPPKKESEDEACSRRLDRTISGASVGSIKKRRDRKRLL